MRRMWWIAAVTLVLDQASKLYVLAGLGLDTRKAIDVLPPYLNLRMAWNRGVNFGLFADEGDTARWIFIAISLAISAWVIWWMRREARPMARVSAGLLLGGAIGNVLDRLLYGAVADFLNMSCCGIDNPYSFNIADIAIFAGAAGLILFTGERKKTP